MNTFLKISSSLLAVLFIADVFGRRVDVQSDDLINSNKAKEDLEVKELKNSLLDSFELSEKKEEKIEIEIENDAKKRRKKNHKKKKPIHKTVYHNKTNLKLVYRKVLPPGMERSKKNVVFEFDDYEEGKKCRCICRMR